ncbi:LamG-like jellyroll fold domain-containing protein [Nonomuraea sp. NPDC050680]|uniref:LamG-like jellyroll fold domain-containing protein n=1 Tax=Nonomuraea sp. NPDC050680 TaxID=3154630 RepID=UPI0033F3DC62
MRRLLAWAHSARFRFGLVFFILAATLPGLLALQPQPVAADSVNAVTASGNVPDTPKQMSGSAAGLPSLVSADVTRATADPGTSKAKIAAPRKALPREAREGVVRSKQAGPLATSLIRGAAPVAVAAAVPPCGSYSPWQRSVYVAYGTYVASGLRIWKAIQNIPANLNIYPPEEQGVDWLLIGDCPKPPPPTVTSMSPDNGIQLTTTQPTLTAEATTWPGGSVGFYFEVCSNPSMTGCVSYDDCCALSGSWAVPEGKLGWGRQYWWRVRVSDASTIGGLSAYTSTRTFVIGVRQPTITSQLSVRGVNGQEFNQQSGNYTTTFTDAQVAAAGPPLSVVRSYNSMDPRGDGAFGAGWSTRWDMRVVAENVRGREAVLVTYPDGRQVRFAKKDDGAYQPPPGMYATLAKNADGSWRLMDKASTSYLFDGGGRLLKVTDSRGRSQELTYGTDGKLAKVTAPGGRSLTFSWTGAHVTTISTDQVDGKALSWGYTYNGDALEKVCDPSQACTLYQLNTGSLYRSTVLDSDPMGYWRLGESSGSEAKDLGWMGEGAHYNTNYTLAKPGALAGTTDTAVEITASNIANVNLPGDLLPRTGTWASVETWFKTTGNGAVLSADGSAVADPYPVVQVTSAGKLSAAFNETSTPIVSGAAVKDGLWHHAVLSIGGDVQTLYLDGQLAGTLNATIPDPEGLESLDIGGGSLSGSIDEVAVYDRPLSAVEVARHYAARVATPHELAKITLPSGRVWAANTYDSSTERIKTHTDQHGGTWQLAEPTLDRTAGTSTVVVTDPKNEKLTAVHDAWRGYRLISKTDQLGNKTGYDYDTGGFLSEMTDANNNTTTWYNDDRGNTLSTSTCRTDSSCQAAYTEFYLNKDDPFDARNDRPLKVRDARSASDTDNTYATSYEYNQYGEQLKVTTPATTDFPNGRSTVIVYTDGTEPAIGGGVMPAGLVKSWTDARGSTGINRYTAAGDLAEQTQPEGLVSTQTYDVLGRMKTRTEVSKAQPGGVTSTYTYDDLGRLATKTGAGVKNEVTDVTHTAQTVYAYDPDGNVLSQTVKDLTGGDPEQTISYTYDGHGREETVTGPEGGVTRTTWDEIGARTTIIDELGSITGLTYTKRGELATRTLKNWTGSPVAPIPAKEIALESFSYDPAGRLAGRADAMGRKTAYNYFNDDLLSQVVADDVKLNGSTTTTDVVIEADTYDNAGNLTQQVLGGTTTRTDYVYDAASRLTSETLDPDELGRKTTYGYDANDNVITTKSTATGTTRVETSEFAYNKENYPTRRTVKNGSQDLTTTWKVDDRGLVVEAVDGRGNLSGADPAAYTTTMRYDLAGQLVEATSPPVQIDKAGTAQQQRVTTRFGYDNAGRQTHGVDGEGRITTSGFDRAGRLTSVTGAPYTPPGGSALTPKTAYGYDPAGRLIKTTDPRGQITTVEYDALGNPVRRTDPPPAAGQPAGQWVSQYDLLGEELAAIDPTGARNEATYDDLGRQITQTAIERKPTTAAYTTKLEYNDAGDPTKVTLPTTKTIGYTVNAAGQVLTETDPLNHTTTYDYDLVGRPAKTTNALGNAITADYDLAGRLTSLKNLDSAGATVKSKGFGYDAADNLTQITSGEGHITRRTFDATDLLTQLVEPVSATDSITSSFGYDATGARTRLTDGRGNATWTGYNTLGLIETLTEPATTAHPDLADRTWTHVYDAAGNETALIQPGGVRLDRQYDQLNRLTQVSGSGAGIVAADKTYSYDLADRVTTVTDQTLEYNDRSLLTKVTGPSGSSSFAYDNMGNPTQRIDATGTTTYTWDNDNRLKTVADPVSGRTNTYGYDNADRLTSITSANPVNTQSYTYDAADRLKTHTLKNSTGGQLAQITYGWDKDDNLTSKITSGTAGAGNNTYGYDHAGRLTSWTGPDGTTTAYEWDASGNRTKAGNKTYTYDQRNRLTSGDGTDYTYTPRGTLASETKNGATRQLTFDAFDRLINDGDATYTYDAFDRMATRQKSGSALQKFAYAGLDNDIIAITDQNGAVQAKYGRDPSGGLVSTQEGDGPALAAMTDIHDDLVGTFSGTALASTTAYNPYGEVTAQTGTQSRLGYQSEYTDPDTGKTNMHARWYQPGTATFASRDTWTLPSGPSIQANRYTYGNGNPAVYSDSSGHSPDPRCYRAVSIPVVGVPVAVGCDVVSDAKGTASDDVCRDGAGRATSCNPPGKCAEFANGCRMPHSDSSSGARPEKVKSQATKGRVSSQSNSTTRTTHYKPTGDPVKHPGPKQPGPKHPGPKSPAFEFGPIIHKHNCGKKCMIEGHPAKDDEEIPIIVVGIDSIAQPVGLDPADFVELPEDRPTTEPAPTPDPEPEPENPPPGDSPEPDCEPFKKYDADPVGRPIVGSARYCRPTDLDGGTDASVDPRYWPSTNPAHPHRPQIRLYDRCHVVAGTLLGGSGGDPNNLVPCISTVNRGPMRRVENAARRTVQDVNGRGVVDYRVEVRYDGRNTIPSRFRMVTSIDGETVSDECIHNDLNKTVTDGYTC